MKIEYDIKDEHVVLFAQQIKNIAADASTEEHEAAIREFVNGLLDPIYESIVSLVVQENPEVIAKELELQQLKKQIEGTIKPVDIKAEGISIEKP